MTTLAAARELAKVMYSQENCPDLEFGEKEQKQFNRITFEKNPYFAYFERLTAEEKARYGWMEDHPDGFELSFYQWVESGAAKRYAKQYEQYLAFKSLSAKEQAEYGWTEHHTLCFENWEQSEAAQRFAEKN